MSEISAFGVDHGEDISKRGGKLARLLGRGTKAANKPQLLPNGKTIEQMKNARFPAPPKPSPAPTKKPFQGMKVGHTPRGRVNGQSTPKPFDNPNGGLGRRKFRSNDITRTDGPLG